MRALVCVPGGVEVTQVPDPQPAAGAVVVRVQACGICGSDVHAVERGLAADGHILGHEFSGTIAALGTAAGAWREGQPVAVNPVGSCADCEVCRQGLPFLCGTMPNLGVSAPGAFAEYVAVPATQLAALPADVDPEIGAHAEPLAVALRAVELGEVSHGDIALVYGVGPIGLNVIMALRLAGAGHIIAVGRSAGRRAAAAAVGAHVVLDARDADVAAYLAEAGVRCRSAYECSGAAHALGETVAALAPGGISVQVALPAEASPLQVRTLVARGLRIVGSCALRPDDYARAVECLVTGQVAGSALISERVPLDGAPDALTRLRQPGELVRVLVRPGQADSGRARRPA